MGIDWWNLQPRWLKRLRLFFGIVWRRYEGPRMTVALSWRVAVCIISTGQQMILATDIAELAYALAIINGSTHDRARELERRRAHELRRLRQMTKEFEA